MPAIYRVDEFIVPDHVLDEFWNNVRRTHSVLRTQPGFLDDVLLEKQSGSGRFNIATIVKWASADDLAAAGAAVARAHQEADFRPGEFFERTGIEANLGNYTEAEA